MPPFLSAGRSTAMLRRLSGLCAVVLVYAPNVFCTGDKHHVNHVGAHHKRFNTATVHSPSLSQPALSPHVASPPNRYFVLMIAMIIAACTLFIGLLALVTHFAHQRRVQIDDMEQPFLEKRAAWELGYSTDRALPSLPFPVISSVSRSTYRNLSSLNMAPFQGYSDDLAPPVPDKSDVSDMVRDQVLKLRASIRHINAPTMSFSLDSKLSSSDACGIRESNLARPCVTHGASGWGIFPSRVTEEDDDVSFHGPQQPMNVV